jgi:hypothetical protein
MDKPNLIITMGPLITNGKVLQENSYVAYENYSTTSSFAIEKNSQYCCTPPSQTVFTGQNILAT